MGLTEVKYKISEKGLIPIDWDVKPIGNEIDLLTGYPFPSNNYVESGVRLLRGSNVKRGNTDWSEEITQYWEKLTPDLLQYVLKDGDIVVAMDGSLVGKSFARLSKKDIPALLLQRVARIRSNKIDLGYLKEFICSDYFTKHCEAVKTVSAIPHISPKDIRSFIIPIPPTKSEQTAIATALSDANTLIDNLEKLIAKKRNIKQGAMQELLKPRINWKDKKLGEASILKARIGWQGLTTAEYKSTGDYFLITGTEFKDGFINWEQCVYVDETRYNQDKNIQIRENDVLVTKDGTIGKIAFIKSLPKPATLNSGVFVIRPINDSFKPEFLFYLLTSEVFKRFLSQLSAGSTINHLYQKDFVSFKFKIPQTIKEQEEISKILSDMDSEVAQLEQKLFKYRNLKQGMMQALLTGNIRLS